MKTKRKVPVTIKHVHFMPDFSTFEKYVIYVSLEFGTTIHSCLCGCGEKVVVPINDPSGWNYIEVDGKITLTPSIGNYQLPCKSHYIITNGVANIV